MKSHMEKVVLELKPEEIQRALRVLMDEDREGAFMFLKDCLEKKLQDKLRPHCVPVFEATYSPRQKDPYPGRQE
jgi:hypothetical protein